MYTGIQQDLCLLAGALVHMLCGPKIAESRRRLNFFFPSFLALKASEQCAGTQYRVLLIHPGRGLPRSAAHQNS